MMQYYAEQITGRLSRKEAMIGVIGLGYVGLPLLLRFCASGFRVQGFDLDRAKVSALQSGDSYISHIDSSEIQIARKKGMSATNDLSASEQCDALILCLPTPLKHNRDPDLSYIIDTIESLAPHLKPGQIISLESTTYPGTTEEEILPRIEQRGFTVGEQIFLVYSPEREDPGNLYFNAYDIPKLVAGRTPACLAAGLCLYKSVVEQLVPMSSIRATEMTKLLENIQRAVNIGLMNEMKLVADRMNIDIFEVVDAASTKPFGFSTYYPGPGLGGHCIPIDPFYLTYKARLLGIDTRFIELSGEINRAMPGHVIQKTKAALEQRAEDLCNAKVLVLGLAYKKNVGDPRESPAIEIIDLLVKEGVNVSYTDPYFPSFPAMRNYQHTLTSITLSPLTLSGFDVVLLITDHDSFDYDLILAHSKLIIDTRGRYRNSPTHVIRA